MDFLFTADVFRMAPGTVCDDILMVQRQPHEKSFKTIGGLSKIDLLQNLDRGRFRTSPASMFHDFGTTLGGAGGLRDLLDGIGGSS